MNEADYSAFLENALAPNDIFQNGLRRHYEVMEAIAGLTVKGLPEDEVLVTGIGRKIDELIISVAVQHMEAALKDPVRGREVIEFLREHIGPRLR